MNGGTLLGVDVGTTGVRAAVFDERGRAVAVAGEPCPYSSPAPGQAECDAEGWWRALQTTLARIRPSAPLDRVEAVGVTGQAPTLVPLDEGGDPTDSAILWLDVRAAAQARAIDAALGPGRCERIGGNRMHAYYLGPKLSWWRENEPAAFDRTALVLQPHAFIVFRLTGQASCDLSTAMLSAPLFDASTQTWSEEGARATGVPTRILPPIAKAHDVVGKVTRRGASATGLREGTPVVAGGGDFAAAALGAGVIDEGEACLMLGTAGNLLMPMKQARFDSRLINSHHVGCEQWLALGGTLCGAALEWFRDACAPGVDWETLEAEAAAVDPQTMAGLLVLPYLQGERTPIWDERVRGILSGVDRVHRRGHLYRALLEGVALGFRDCLAVAEQHGAKFGQLVAANGAGKSALLRQTLADALDLPLVWSDGSEGAGGTLTGAALLAGLGGGLVPGPETSRTWRTSGVCHEPDPRSRDRLCEVFARRRSVYDAVRDRV